MNEGGRLTRADRQRAALVRITSPVGRDDSGAPCSRLIPSRRVISQRLANAGTRALITTGGHPTTCRRRVASSRRRGSVAQHGITFCASFDSPPLTKDCFSCNLHSHRTQSWEVRQRGSQCRRMAAAWNYCREELTEGGFESLACCLNSIGRAIRGGRAEQTRVARSNLNLALF